MFCKKCGCRIPSNASKCPDCGSDLPNMEYCSGFWSELNQNSQTQKMHSNQAVKEKENTPQSAKEADTNLNPKVKEKFNTDKKGTKKTSILKYAAIVEGLIIIILFLSTTVSNFALKREVNELKTQNAAADENYKELEKQNKAIQTENESLQEQNKKWEQDYKALSQEYDLLYEKLSELEKQTEDLNEQETETESEPQIPNEEYSSEEELTGSVM